jgi:hypothetical protein
MVRHLDWWRGSRRVRHAVFRQSAKKHECTKLFKRGSVMSNYIRVLPRDLFNEANLLKCLGALWIAVENSDKARFTVDDVDQFDIRQSDSDGSTYVANAPFEIEGEGYHLFRPMNSREAWPLLAVISNDDDADCISVFNDDGTLSDDMKALIR